MLDRMTRLNKVVQKYSAFIDAGSTDPNEWELHIPEETPKDQNGVRKLWEFCRELSLINFKQDRDKTPDQLKSLFDAWSEEVKTENPESKNILKTQWEYLISEADNEFDTVLSNIEADSLWKNMTE